MLCGSGEEVRLEITAAIVDATDDDGGLGYGDSEHDAPAKGDDSESRQEVIASGSAVRKGVQRRTVRDDRSHEGVVARETRVVSNVTVD